MNRPGFAGECFVQNLGYFIKTIQICIESLLCFFWRDVSDGAVPDCCCRCRVRPVPYRNAVCCCPEDHPDSFGSGAARAIGKAARVSDAVKAGGQDVDQKAADERVAGQARRSIQPTIQMARDQRNKRRCRVSSLVLIRWTAINLSSKPRHQRTLLAPSLKCRGTDTMSK